MAKKKKAKSLESILAGAEKLFHRGNYPLAKREFEKALRLIGPSGPEAGRKVEGEGLAEKREEIATKIEICSKEAERLKAEDLVRRAKKYAGKRNLQGALRCYEQAYKITGEDWIQEKMGRLQGALRRRDTVKSARDAEAGGEFEKAAALYEQAFITQKREDLLAKRACCLVKAKRYEEAISVFKDLVVSDHGAIYNYGFALARVGRYYECLKVWDNIASQANGFLEQKKAVRSLLAADLYKRFGRGQDLARIYEEGQYLLNVTDRQSPDQDIDSLVEYCRYAWIEELWEEERYETIWELSVHLPARMEPARHRPPDTDSGLPAGARRPARHCLVCRHCTCPASVAVAGGWQAGEAGGPALLALCAKTSFKLAEISTEHLADLSMFWLTAVYGEIFGRFSSAMEESDNVRRQLIRMAEDLITRHANSGDGAAEKALTYWNIEKKLVEDLSALVGARQDFAHLVCTPRFAARFGKSAKVLRLIRENREFFENTEHYLATGSFYSPAWQSLYDIENGEYDKALGGLASILSETKDMDEFADYSVKRAKFAYGLYCLEQGENRPGRYLEAAAGLFDIAPRYEKKLIEKAMDADEPDDLRRYEEVLSDLHKKRPSKPMKAALSLVMSRRAIEMYNQRLINPKTLETISRKALILDPENELARGNLNDVQLDLQIQALGKALDKHKMNKACKIAAESEYQEVPDAFFEFMGRNVETLEEMDMEDEEKILLLKELFGWCARVDESHSILYDIDRMLRQLQS